MYFEKKMKEKKHIYTHITRSIGMIGIYYSLLAELRMRHANNML